MERTKTHKYPDPEKIEINESDLRHQFQEFAGAIKGKISLSDLLIVGPAWIPVFTSEFQSIGTLSGQTIWGGYVAFLLMGTGAWLLQGRGALLNLLFYTLRIQNPERKRKYESDSERKVRSIRSSCNCNSCREEVRIKRVRGGEKKS